MTNEEKQALIDTASEDIQFLENVREKRGHLFELEEQKLALTKIALAALTAQPVKLPDYTAEVYPNHALENQKIKSRNEAISDCADAIRSAGYEVQE